MNEILYGINIEEIERITGETQKVIKKWKKGTKPIPDVDTGLKLTTHYG